MHAGHSFMRVRRPSMKVKIHQGYFCIFVEVSTLRSLMEKKSNATCSRSLLR